MNNTIIKAAAAASLLVIGASSLMAQQRDGNVAVDKKTEKGDITTPAKQAPSGAVEDKKQQNDSNAAVNPAGKDDKTAVGSRALGADDKPTDPNTPKQGEIKKLDKQGRGGQQN